MAEAIGVRGDLDERAEFLDRDDGLINDPWNLFRRNLFRLSIQPPLRGTASSLGFRPFVQAWHRISLGARYSDLRVVG